jgi:hypothetical protein
MRTLQRYVRLTPFERWIVVQCFAGLLVTRAGLRLLGFGVWKKLVASVTPVVSVSRNVERAASVSSAIARMQAAAERRLFFAPNCLEHALVLWWLLRSRGIPADIRLGGRKELGRFEAHAWVELEGMPVGDRNGAQRDFVPFEGPGTLMESQTR